MSPFLIVAQPSCARATYGIPMPIGDVDHYIPALEAALACVGIFHEDRSKQDIAK